MYQNYSSYLVEASGIEPLSESASTGASPNNIFLESQPKIIVTTVYIAY